MQILHDFFIVLIDKKYNSDQTPTGILTLNEAYMEDKAEGHLKHRRQFGVVIGTPAIFTDTLVDVIVPGMPEPRIFVSADHMQEKANMGFSKLPQYYPSSYDEFPQVTLLDIAQKTDIRKGDKIYFDYMSTEDKRFLGPHRDGNLYQIRVDEVYCSVRIVDGKPQIITQGEWCLVEPDFETWEDITSPNGVITKAAPGAKFEPTFDDETGDQVDWKMVIEGKYLQGFVRHISNRKNVKAGDKIMYERNADYVVNIEGTAYYVMKESDLLCVVN